MLSIAFILFTFLPIACNAGDFSFLPHEIKREIFNGLSAAQHMRALIRLNRCGNQYTRALYHNETQLLHQLQIAIDTNAQSRIKCLTKELQLSELFALKLPYLLGLIDHKEQRRYILSAMNMHAMSISELRTMNQKANVNPHLQILILASRALIHYYVPYDGGAYFNDRFVMVRLPGSTRSCLVYMKYPWLAVQSSVSACDVQPDSRWVIYLTYLYEHIFDHHHVQSEIPSLDHVFVKNNDVNRARLLDIIDKYGLILWHRDTIHGIRTRYFRTSSNVSLSDIILEALRIKRILFGQPTDLMHVDDTSRFMSRFILDLVQKYSVTIDLHQNKVNELITYLETLRYCNHKLQRYDAFKELTKLLCSHSPMTPLVFMQNFDERYANDTIDVLCEVYKLSSANVIETFNYLIIQRSVNYWNINDKQRALAEIKRIATQPLFMENVLDVFVGIMNQGNMTLLYEYVHDVLAALCQTRTDWDFQSAIQLSNSSNITQLLLTFHK
eukprot:640829_1